MRNVYTVLRVYNQSLKPEFNGLFCEKIFGPVNDFECACGKKPINFEKFCPNCDVEFISSQTRRYRLGYIQLNNPVIHVWYLKGRPSYLSIVLNFKRKKMESLAYCSESILNTIFPENLKSIFYYYSELSPRTVKIRSFRNINIDQFNKLFMSPFKPNLKWNLFLLNKKKLDFSLIKKLLKSKIYNFKNLTIKPNNFALNPSSLRIFLLSKNCWKVKKNKSSLIKIDNNKTIDHQRIDNHQLSFINSYYSISKYFGWENPIKNIHFVYYMTSFPENKDFRISFYNDYFKKENTQKKIFPYVGTQIFKLLLNEISQYMSLEALERQIRINLFEINAFPSFSEVFQKVKLLRRLKLIWYFRLTTNEPSWMILSVLPVLPPALRPIIQLDDNQIAISDLNKLYQKVIFRNNRIQKLKIGHYSNTSEEIQYAQRLLQESVDSLIENGKGGLLPSSSLNGRPLKSLSDVLKGKKGRFRQNLLGKRVDYSGRSVIVVGPYLKVYECGIPKEMALELFQPFIIQRLIFYKKAKTILGAKKLIQNENSIIDEIINEIFNNHPVLLNRAPTLHRLSVQSFKPRLVEGRAIVLHPLVCTAFNADFDGDQMAVHIPLSYEARSEAWKLLWSQNNILSPATGFPILSPTQDMVLGWYFLTAMDSKSFYIKLFQDTKFKIRLNKIKKIFQSQKVKNFYKFKIFKKNYQILSLYNQQKIAFHTPIWFYCIQNFEIDKKYNPTLELRFYSSGNLLIFSYHFQFYYDWFGYKISQFLLTTAGRILINSLG